MKLNQRGHDVGFCFNRKEAKDHGEGGLLVGAKPERGTRILIVEDVTTAGTSIRETVPLLQAAAPIELVGLVVSVDRRERGLGERAALTELRDSYGMKTFSIVNIDDILEHLRGRSLGGRVVLSEQDYQRARSYRERYGAS
jgi:orotate phosphoribosyltransferase